MKQKTDIYGTLGPSCRSVEVLEAMFREGMTGIRLNLSHTSLIEAEEQIRTYHHAAEKCGLQAKLLIDMQGPELRIGKLKEPLLLENGTNCLFISIDAGSQNGKKQEEKQSGQQLQRDSLQKNVMQAPLLKTGILQETVPQIPVPEIVMAALKPGAEVLLDDGKILLEILAENAQQSDEGIPARVLRGGILTGSKSIAIPGSYINSPAMTQQDLENIRKAGNYGVTGVMQPFVRSAEDLKEVRRALDQAGWKDIRLFAKIENMDGVQNLESFFPLADEIVIARGDLGNAMPLWELPGVQKQIERKCLEAGKAFMVVTQMLSSMEHSPVPTRAEVSDIYNAVADGAASVMVTGETAVGQYPVEVIKYLARTADSYRKI